MHLLIIRLWKSFSYATTFCHTYGLSWKSFTWCLQFSSGDVSCFWHLHHPGTSSALRLPLKKSMQSPLKNSNFATHYFLLSPITLMFCIPAKGASCRCWHLLNSANLFDSFSCLVCICLVYQVKCVHTSFFPWKNELLKSFCSMFGLLILMRSLAKIIWQFTFHSPRAVSSKEGVEF